MAFSEMTEYSEGNFPVPGVCSEYTLCENASAYKPIDVSGLSGAVSDSLDALMTDADNSEKIIENWISTLSTEWGVKYIELNDNRLDIVNEENYGNNISSLKGNINEQKARCEEIVNTIVGKTSLVTAYLNALEENKRAYEEVLRSIDICNNDIQRLENSNRRELNKEHPDYGLVQANNAKLPRLYEELNNLNSKKGLYEANRIDSPDGSWVLG